jgi:hypothetical protein
VHLDLWITADAKHLLATLAAQRRQELHETLADALAALQATEGGTAAGVFTESQINALIERALKDLLASQGSVAVPTSTDPPLESQAHPDSHPDPLPPPGWKQCREGHPPYDPSTHKECPTHVRERKQRSRDKQAREAGGDVPTRNMTTGEDV